MSQQPSAFVGSSAAEAPPPVAGGDKPAGEKAKKDKKKKESRGIETMYRVTYQNHIALSQLADNKANMLISINGLIISLVIAIVTRTGAVAWSLVPMLVLITGSMISLAFAVLAARPRLSRSPVTIDQVRSGTGNLLFFGQFTTMPLAEFQDSLRVLTKDRKLLYAHLGRQLYHMGESLNGKYRSLQVAYAAFLIGTAVATALFVLMYATGGFGPAA
jgi:CHASE1-domain containing sensor protein